MISQHRHSSQKGGSHAYGQTLHGKPAREEVRPIPRWHRRRGLVEHDRDAERTTENLVPHDRTATVSLTTPHDRTFVYLKIVKHPGTTKRDTVITAPIWIVVVH